MLLPISLPTSHVLGSFASHSLTLLLSYSLSRSFFFYSVFNAAEGTNHYQCKRRKQVVRTELAPCPRQPSLLVPNIANISSSTATRKTARWSFLFSAWSTLLADISVFVRATFCAISTTSPSTPSPPYVSIGRRFTCSACRRSLSTSPYNAVVPGMDEAFPHFLACGVRTVTSIEESLVIVWRTSGNVKGGVGLWSRTEWDKHVRHQPQSATDVAPLSGFVSVQCAASDGQVGRLHTWGVSSTSPSWQHISHQCFQTRPHVILVIVAPFASGHWHCRLFEACTRARCRESDALLLLLHLFPHLDCHQRPDRHVPRANFLWCSRPGLSHCAGASARFLPVVGHTAIGPAAHSSAIPLVISMRPSRSTYLPHRGDDGSLPSPLARPLVLRSGPARAAVRGAARVVDPVFQVMRLRGSFPGRTHDHRRPTKCDCHISTRRGPQHVDAI